MARWVTQHSLALYGAHNSLALDGGGLGWGWAFGRRGENLGKYVLVDYVNSRRKKALG